MNYELGYESLERNIETVQRYINVRITDPLGLHLRNIVQIVKICKRFETEIFLHYNGRLSSTRSLTGMVFLEAGINAELTITARGKDSEVALETLSELEFFSVV